MTRDFAAVAARISSIPAAAEAALNGAVQIAAASCAETARILVPVDSGALRASIAVASTGAGSANVRATADYAAMVEYGTSRMPPRPYMQPAALSARTVLPQTAIAAVRGALGGSKR